MKVLHDLVEHWQTLEEIEQPDPLCCHGAHAIQFLECGKVYSDMPQVLAKLLGGNAAQVILMLRQAGAPADPIGAASWKNREAIYARLLQVERLPSLAGANLKMADLRGAKLKGANLKGADLIGVNLIGVNLEGASLIGVNLEGASLKGANLKGANLEGADLNRSSLEGANLEGANLKNANLECANLKGADLEGVNFEGANLKDANVMGTIWAKLKILNT